MNRVWAITASAGDADASERAAVAAGVDSWMRGGGVCIPLVTCHRAEAYGLGPEPTIASTRTLHDQDAVRHLVRVACGLESVIVGEDEVLHQVRESLRVALRRGVDPRLQRLFETAIAAGRSARAGRTRSSGNLAQSAIQWMRGKADLDGRRVLIGGAGRMGSALAHAASVAGGRVVVASRDAGRARRLARVYEGIGVDLDDGAALVPGAAGVAVALGGPWSQLARLRADRLPPVADISSPSAVPDAIRGSLNGGFLGIDDLFAGGTRAAPGAYVENAERVVERKTAEIVAWLERAA